MNEPWIERVIREAQQAGKFDGVEGAGRPIPDLDLHYEPGWWARKWVHRERQRVDTIELVRELKNFLPRILAGTVEHEVRARLESLNTKIKQHNTSSPAGEGLPLLDVDRLLVERAGRHRT